MKKELTAEQQDALLEHMNLFPNMSWIFHITWFKLAYNIEISEIECASLAFNSQFKFERC